MWLLMLHVQLQHIVFEKLMQLQIYTIYKHSYVMIFTTSNFKGKLFYVSTQRVKFKQDVRTNFLLNKYWLKSVVFVMNNM